MSLSFPGWHLQACQGVPSQGKALKTRVALGTLVRRLACISTPGSSAVTSEAAKRQGKGAKAESCQTSGLVYTRFPKAFGALLVCTKGSVPGPGQFRAGLLWWTLDELSFPITCTRNSWDIPKHKPCNYGVCVSKLDQTEPEGLTKVLDDAALHACFLQLPGQRGHCHKVKSLVACREVSWLPKAPRGLGR